MDYFNFFKLPVSFKVDESALRRAYLKNSKKYHPDFHADADTAVQEEMLQLSTLNNEAYRTLLDADKRMKYVLELKGVLKDGDSEGNQLPPEFLLDMMEINEELMELEFDFDENALKSAESKVKALESRLFSEVEQILEDYNGSQEHCGDLEKVKIFYLKKRYLLRVKEKLSTFAPA